MSNVRVISPDGRETYVKPEDLSKALSAGYKQADTETSRAAGESALRGLTLGVSDQFLAGATGAPYQGADGRWYSGDLSISGPDAAGALDQSAQIKRRKEENPGVAAVGEIAGAVLGPGKFFRAGNTLKSAVGLGVAEGSLLGLGAAISEDGLGDKEALGEKLVANVGLSALAGGAGGALGLGLTRGAEALSKKLANYTLGADVQGLKNLAKGIRGGPYKSAAEKAGLDWSYVDKLAKEEGIFTARATPESVAAMAGDLQQRARAEALKGVEELGGPGGLFDLDALAQGLSKEGQDIARGFTKAERNLGSKFEMEAASMASDARGVPTWDRWVDMVTSLRASGREADRRIGQSVYERGLKQLVEIDEEGALRIADALNKEQAAAFLAGRVRGAPSTSMGDAVQAGAVGGLFGGPSGAVSGAVGTLAAGEVRSRAPFLTAAALEELGPGLIRAANGLQTRVTKVLQNAPALLGPYREVLTAAMAEGAPELLRVHSELASGANGSDYLSRLAMEHEDAATAEAATARAAIYDSLESQARRVDERIERWAGRMTGSVSGPAPAVPAASKEPFDTRVEKLRAMANNPEGYLSAMPSEMLRDAPASTMAFAAMTTKAAQYLLERAPKNPYAHLPENLRPKWLPAPGDLANFEAAAAGVEDPLGALERMQRGATSPETLKAIAAVYPRIWEDARARLFDRVATAKNLSYEQRLRLQPILGPMATGSTPEQAIYLQQMHDKQRMPPQAAGASPDGRQVVSTTKNLDTQAQRLEARGVQT